MRMPDVDSRALERLLVRAFGRQDGFSVERTPTGSSTQVYRVLRRAESFYVRIAEGPESSLAPEVELHRILHSSGARVPGVVYYEPFDEALVRSVMVTTEVAGHPLNATAHPDAAPEIGRAAGRDLARIHSVPVLGFGWICREHHEAGWPLRGQHPTYADYVAPAAVHQPLVGIGFGVDAADRVVRLLEEAIEIRPSDPTGSVAHGDFDASHIFESDGVYTGLIDFGEIRGSDYTFDFATMYLNAEPARSFYRQLEQGYSEIRPLPPDHQRRLYLACVLSASHRLARWFQRDGAGAADGWFFRWIRDRLDALLRSGELPEPP